MSQADRSILRTEQKKHHSVVKSGIGIAEKGRRENAQLVGNLFSRNSRPCHSERQRRISRFLYLAKPRSFGNYLRMTLRHGLDAREDEEGGFSSLRKA
jgi:hypothetical protein